MAVDRLTDTSGSAGPLSGNTYLNQVSEEIKAIWDSGTVLTLTAVSGTNTIAATLAPVLSAGLGNGMNVILKPAATNSGAVTLAINGGSAVSVVDAEGVALTAGALRINNHYLLNYDSGIAKWVVIGYTPSAVVPYGTKLLGVRSGAASSYDFFNGANDDRAIPVVLDSTYDSYTLRINSAAPVTDDVEAWLRVGTGVTPTYQTANYTWWWRGWLTAESAQGNNSASSIIMTRNSATTDVGNASGESFSATIEFSDPDANQYFSVSGTNRWRAASGNAAFGAFGGQYTVQGAITAIRFQFETGNIASGSAFLYGHAKS